MHAGRHAQTCNVMSNDGTLLRIDTIAEKEGEKREKEKQEALYVSYAHLGRRGERGRREHFPFVFLLRTGDRINGGQSDKSSLSKMQ